MSNKTTELKEYKDYVDYVKKRFDELMSKTLKVGHRKYIYRYLFTHKKTLKQSIYYGISSNIKEREKEHQIGHWSGTKSVIYNLINDKNWNYELKEIKWTKNNFPFKEYINCHYQTQKNTKTKKKFFSLLWNKRLYKAEKKEDLISLIDGFDLYNAEKIERVLINTIHYFYWKKYLILNIAKKERHIVNEIFTPPIIPTEKEKLPTLDKIENLVLMKINELDSFWLSTKEFNDYKYVFIKRYNFIQNIDEKRTKMFILYKKMLFSSFLNPLLTKGVIKHLAQEIKNLIEIYENTRYKIETLKFENERIKDFLLEHQKELKVKTN